MGELDMHVRGANRSRDRFGMAVAGLRAVVVREIVAEKVDKVSRL